MFHRFEEKYSIKFRRSRAENKEDLENMIPQRNAAAEAINKHKDEFIKIILEKGLKNNGSQLSKKSKDALTPIIASMEEGLKKKTGEVYASVRVDLSYTHIIYLRVSCGRFDLSKCILRKDVEFVLSGRKPAIWKLVGIEPLCEEDNAPLEYYYFADSLRAFTELEKKREQAKALADEVRELERSIIDLLKD